MVKPSISLWIILKTMEMVECRATWQEVGTHGIPDPRADCPRIRAYLPAGYLLSLGSAEC